ncbi:MAG: tryptophan 2,3-dioxygenase [Deltaproteobacteria bacterium]|jgi:tryptophan 2,3-dioxygenase|nr:tryptophan 2,3-dioxygenase [Deltaproteobacteria bacterium]MBW2532681.1 tryptophan 2,3-dioxygenase [Deltaproteobacteria bacterium]
MPLTYGSYLQLDRLLDLQRPASDQPAHDELLFIIAHQAYELWFKQALHEIDLLQRQLGDGELVQARSALRRIIAILRVLVQQVDVLETMTPVGFAEFRPALGSASGFQSIQFRELEAVLGLKDPAALSRAAAAGAPIDRLEKRHRERSVWESFVALLQARGHRVDEAPPPTTLTDAPVPSSPWLAQLTAALRADASCLEIAEQLLDVDGLLLRWRQRHVSMVARMIGNRPGTGGSPGVAYLETTLSHRCFPALWAIRGALLDGR